MFDQLKSMGAIAGLLKDKERMRAIGEQVKAALDEARVEGSAGGGAVRVLMTGRMQVVNVQVDPAMCAGMAADEQSRSMAESLITEATNDAIEKAQRVAHQEVNRVAEELGLPEMPGIEKFLTGA